MRIAKSIFVGSIAVVAALASPAFASESSLNSHANANAKTEDEPVSPAPGCRAYQKGPDGSWVETACHEGAGSANAPAPVRSKSASHHPANGNATR
jgi:hypothetical protein